MTDWYYIDGPRRVGPFDDEEWGGLLKEGKVGPDTLVWNEKLAGWVALRTLPPSMQLAIEDEEDFKNDVFVDRPADAGIASDWAGESPEAFLERITPLDYAVATGAALRRAFDLFRGHFWMLLGATLLTWILISVGSSLPSILALAMPLALNGVLYGGLFSLYLRLLRGQPALPTDLFSGFEAGVFRHLAMRTLIGTLVGYGSLYAAIVALRIAGFEIVHPEEADPEAITAQLSAFLNSLDAPSLLAVLLAMLACAAPATYLSFCWVFATVLIRDKRISCWEALRLSRHKVMQHPWRIAVTLSLAALTVSLPGAVAAAFVIFLGRFIPSVAESGTPLLVVAISAVTLAVPFYIGTLLSLYEAIFRGEGDPAAIPAGHQSGESETGAAPGRVGRGE